MEASRRAECFEDNKVIVEELSEVDNLSHDSVESKTVAEGTSTVENISKLQSPLLKTIVNLVARYGNDECVEETCRFLRSKNETAADDKIRDREPAGVLTDYKSVQGVAESVKAQHAHNKNNWKLIRDTCVSKKLSNYNNYNSNHVSALWNQLLENDIFKQTTPLGNTVLHIAAANGNKHFVEEIIREAPQLLTAKSLNGDTALHVAAKSGHFSALKNLIAAHFKSSENRQIHHHQEEALEKILEKNNEGNNFFHEALINGHQGMMNFLLSHDDGNLKEVAKGAALSVTSNEMKSGVYLAIESGYKDVVHLALTQVIPKDPNYVPQGKSLLLAAIIKQDQDILGAILTKKPEWVHLIDTEGRIPLHYAASRGYLKGVEYLLRECASCVMERDIYGYLPIHLASYGGHVKVVQELLKSEYCPDPREILDNGGRNILHLAAQSGKLSVVKYILRASNHELQNMINEQDCNRNTPLHLATMCCHPKIVHALTWDKRVDLSLVNRIGQTALDVFAYSENSSLRQRLTWVALISAGVRCTEAKPQPIKVPPQCTYNFLQPNAAKTDQYKDRINTLMLVSTLIVTVSFASGFTMPGGTNGSGAAGEGMAVMLHHLWFKLFIFCITISVYGAISVTIILIWAQLGDITLALLALKVASPLLGITLGTLSLAFLAGVQLVIRDISWLATTSMAMGFLFIFMLLLLYTVLWFPSSSSKLVIRYMSYYPFLLLASLVEDDKD